MFLWTDPFKQPTSKEAQPKLGQTGGLVSARCLALDSILRSLILDPEGPEVRAMMRRDVRIMLATDRLQGRCEATANVYQEAIETMTTLKRSLS
jgi:hypothetical protein